MGVSPDPISFVAPATKTPTPMLNSKLHALRATFASLLLFTLTGCAGLGGGLPAALVDTLGQVTGLSSNIAGWQDSLGGMLDSNGLTQLKEFAGQAGQLGGTIENLTGGLSEAMQDPLKAIGGKLTEMSGLDVDSLKNLAPTQQMEAVNRFTGTATEVGDLASGFLSKFGA